MTEKSMQILAVRYIARALRVLEFGGELPPLPEGLTFGHVFSVSGRHSLRGTLWYVLADKVRGEAPEELCRQWAKARDIDFATNLVQTAEFKKLTVLFTEHKYPFLPMKGFLFKSLWSRPQYRTMADMDFYVTEDNLPAISELLLSVGYTVDVEDGLVHDTFDKPPYLHVEVHKALRVGSRDSFECWTPKADNPYWYVMSDTDFVVFNIAHIHKHFSTGGCGMRSLFDIYLYMKRGAQELDLDALYEKLREEGLLEFYHKIMHLAYFWYGEEGEVPTAYDPKYLKEGTLSDSMAEMEAFIATGGAYGTVDNSVAYKVHSKGKFRYILSLAFPPYRKTMCKLFPWLKYLPILLPFAYILRWLMALFDGRMLTYFKRIKKSKDTKIGD